MGLTPKKERKKMLQQAVWHRVMPYGALAIGLVAGLMSIREAGVFLAVFEVAYWVAYWMWSTRSS